MDTRDLIGLGDLINERDRRLLFDPAHNARTYFINMVRSSGGLTAANTSITAEDFYRALREDLLRQAPSAKVYDLASERERRRLTGSGDAAS